MYCVNLYSVQKGRAEQPIVSLILRFQAEKTISPILFYLYFKILDFSVQYKSNSNETKSSFQVPTSTTYIIAFESDHVLNLISEIPKVWRTFWWK